MEINNDLRNAISGSFEKKCINKKGRKIKIKNR